MTSRATPVWLITVQRLGRLLAPPELYLFKADASAEADRWRRFTRGLKSVQIEVWPLAVIDPSAELWVGHFVREDSNPEPPVLVFGRRQAGRWIVSPTATGTQSEVVESTADLLVSKAIDHRAIVAEAHLVKIVHHRLSSFTEEG
jgi:hypothetical protein